MDRDLLFADIPGQSAAIDQLVAATARPVHAYLLVGPPGTGKSRAARGFAAALLCPEGGCGSCSQCTRALSGVHPDLVVAEHQGVGYRVEELARLIAIAQRRPLEATRTVIVIPEAHLMGPSAAALLKTLEEPVPTTVFVLIADDIPRDFVTIRSRCAEVAFRALTTHDIAAWLVESGLDPTRAAELAEGASGDADRARLLADDPGFAARLDRWRSVSRVLDGRGTTAVTLAHELHASLAEATAPLMAVHEAEIATLEAEATAMGERGLPGRKELVERHRREIRRYQTTELRAGLAVMARGYRDDLRRAIEGDDLETARRAASAIDAISRLTDAMRRNPRQPLALERLFLELR